MEKKPMAVDDQCLMELLRGMCLKHMGCPLQVQIHQCALSRYSFSSVLSPGTALAVCSLQVQL